MVLNVLNMFKQNSECKILIQTRHYYFIKICNIFPGFSWSKVWISASSYNNRCKRTRHDARVCAWCSGGSRVIRQVVQERYEYSAPCLHPTANQHHPHKLQQQGIKDIMIV